MAAESVILSEIRAALAQHLRKDVEKIQPDHKLREDLGLDSLSTLELLFKLEEAFDMEIPNEDLPRLSTVASVGEYIEERLAKGDGHVAAAPGGLAAMASKAVGAAARPAATPSSAARPAAPSAPARSPAPTPAAPAAAKPATTRPAAAAKPAAKRATAAKPAPKGAKPKVRPRA